MKDTSCIDKKCLYITFHLNNGNDFHSVNYEIHRFLKDLVTKRKLPLRRQPSIISSLDFEDSKLGKLSKKDPHIHMLVFFAERSGEATLNDYRAKLLDFLSDNPRVSLKGASPIQVTLFDDRGSIPLNKQLLNVLNYNRKARLGNDRDVMVLPHHDIMISDKNDLLKNRLKRNSDMIFANLNDQAKHHLHYSKAV